MRNDNCCQYSMAFEEESKNLATNEEEHQDLQVKLIKLLIFL